MKKGNKKKTEIQKVTKELIIEKGYGAVTMSEIGQVLQLSAGGLYYHYHSVEEIFLDIVTNETRQVWDLFSEADTIDSLILAFKQYFELEKADLLDADNTLNAIFYQYYYSFPLTVRKEKMGAAYSETIGMITEILNKVYHSPQVAECLANHIYVMLQGLNMLAMTGQIKEETIDREFQETEKLMSRLFLESEGA